MKHINFFQRISEFKAKFDEFACQHKKLRALENYSEVFTIQHKDYILLIKKCMDGAFLGEKEADFLCYLSEKYFIRYSFLDWSHKTKWLKEEIRKLKAPAKKQDFVQYDLFDFDKPKAVATAKIPVAAMAQKAPRRPYRRAF